MILSLLDYVALSTIFVIPLSFAAFYLRGIKQDTQSFKDEIRRIVTDLTGDVDGLDQRIERHVGTLNLSIEKLKDGKTEKYDWVRETVEVRKALTEMMGEIKSLAAKYETNLGIAAALSGLLAEIRKKGLSNV